MRKQIVKVCLVVMLSLLVACGKEQSSVEIMESAIPTSTAAATDTPTVVPGTEEPIVSEEPIKATPEITVEPAPTENPHDVVSFSFTASGDNLIHSGIYEQARKMSSGGGYDFSYSYRQVKKFFLKHDLNWINQETLVNDKFAASSYPCFSTPTQVVKNLRDCGFTVFNTASNHSYDKGADGLVASMQFWKKIARDTHPVYQCGIVQSRNPVPELVYELKGLKIGFLSYTYGTNGITITGKSRYRVVGLNEESLIEEQVKDLRNRVDVLMVSCHWGTEDSHVITSEQKILAKKLTKWGADLIIGTHPHVLQNCAWVKSGGRKAFCAYSLGNFISTQIHDSQRVGGTLECRIKVDKATHKVQIENPQIRPTATLYSENRTNIRTVWLKDIDNSDYENIARSVVSKRFLDL